MSFDIFKEERVFIASVYVVRGYHLIRGELFSSFSKGMFEVQFFFCSSGLGEGHVSIQISNAVKIGCILGDSRCS